MRMRLIRGSGYGGRERPGVSQGHSLREGLAEPTVPGGFTGRAGLFREGLRQCPGVSKVRSKRDGEGSAAPSVMPSWDLVGLNPSKGSDLRLIPGFTFNPGGHPAPVVAFIQGEENQVLGV